MASAEIAQLPLNFQGQSLSGKVCQECGYALIIKSARDLVRKRFCSKRCRSKASGRLRTPFIVNRSRPCRSCGAVFIARWARNVFCSHRCQQVDATRRWDARRQTLSDYMGRVANRRFKTRDRSQISRSYLLELWRSQNGLCAISGRAMTYGTGDGQVNTNASLDRIDSSKGYYEGNVQLVCFIVNLMKRDMTTAELISWATAISEHGSAIIQQEPSPHHAGRGS